MKKRFLSILLVLVMVLSLLPVMALADDEPAIEAQVAEESVDEPAAELTTQERKSSHCVIDLTGATFDFNSNSSFAINGVTKTVTPGEVNTFTIPADQTLNGNIPIL
jgi:ABC-type transport system involved in cytochrome bd biosynthesis fused ATPase/permease subunit